MKCMLCLGVVVRLNSFRGFNLAHSVQYWPRLGGHWCRSLPPQSLSCVGESSWGSQ